MQKNISIYIILYLIIFVTSCKNNQDSKNKSERKISFTFDTVNIKLKKNFSGTLLKPEYFYDGADKIISYNNTEHAIEIYNLDSMYSSKKIALQYRGENGIESVSDLHIISKDTVLIRSKYTHLYIISLNKSPKLVKKIDLNTIKGINQQSYTFLREGIHARNFDDLAVSENNQYVLLPIYPTIRKKEWEKFHQKEFMAKIWLNKDSASVMPITYHKKFTKNSYADFDYPDFNWVHNKILFTFRNHNTIYTCNLLGTSINKFTSNGDYIEETIAPAPEKTKYDTEYLRNSSHYYGIKYDSFRNIYYRFYVTKNINKEQFHLIALDTNFKKISELALPFKHYGRDFISPNGIMFPTDVIKQKDQTFLQLIRINTTQSN